MRPRRLVPLSLALLAAACGDDPGSDATSAPTGVTVAPATSLTPTDPGDDATTSDTTTDQTTVDPSAGLVDDAIVVSAQLPSALGCGEASNVAITMRNTGTSAWTNEIFKLGAVDDSDPFFNDDTRVYLGDGARIPPGDEHTFAFSLTAPAEPGVYTTDWQMVHEGVQWFGAVATSEVTVACDTDIPGGVPRLEDHALIDDKGPFLGLGATMMWAAWGYKNDRPRLEQNLQYLADHGFNYIRALGTVGDPNGEDYWDGREIDPNWPDYPEVIAGLTDLAYDTYGLRMEWTLIGDGQFSVPTFESRQALVQTFLAMAAGREHKILHFEIANESWQNGFGGDQGLADLRALATTMRAESPNLVAASAPPSATCEETLAIYGGDVADIATVHFDRDISKIEGPWRPVRQPWEHQLCAGLPVGSNNEPIGPGSSVAEEQDPLRLVAAAITTYVSGLPLHVYHTRAGIRGDDDIWNMAGADKFIHLAELLPPDLSDWDPKDADWPDHPFTVFAGENGQLLPDTMWVDVGAPESGVVRAHAAVRDPDFIVLPIGIFNNVTVAPRRPLTFDVIDPLTGNVLASHDLSAGQQVQLSGAEALLIKGTYK